jgi:hypothetical protein
MEQTSTLVFLKLEVINKIKEPRKFDNLGLMFSVNLEGAFAERRSQIR